MSLSLGNDETRSGRAIETTTKEIIKKFMNDFFLTFLNCEWD